MKKDKVIEAVGGTEKGNGQEVKTNIWQCVQIEK